MSFFVYFSYFFCFNDTATTEIYTTTDTLPYTTLFRSRCRRSRLRHSPAAPRSSSRHPTRSEEHTSELQSPVVISYAVFCLKKTKTNWSPLQSDGVDKSEKFQEYCPGR